MKPYHFILRSRQSPLLVCRLLILSLCASGLVPLLAIDPSPLSSDEIGLTPPPKTAPSPALGASDQEGSTASAIGAKLRGFLPYQVVNAGRAGVLNVKDRQQKAIQLLHDKAGDDVKIHLRPGQQTVMQIRGASLEKAAQVAKANVEERNTATARNFLRSNRDLLRIDDPDNEWALQKQERDELGHDHLKFEQIYRGIPVWPTGLGVHVGGDGAVYLVDGAYIATPNTLATEPTLAAAGAQAQAISGLDHGETAEVGPAQLIVYAPLEKAPRLAWKLSVTVDAMHSWITVVDATDGTVLNRISQVMDANVAASSTDLLGKTRAINVWAQDNKFYMFDTSKQMFKAGTDPFQHDTAGVIRVLDGEDKSTDEVLKSAALVSTVNSSTWLPDAVSAAFNFSITYDYFLQHHSRNSLDGKGGSILAIVRVADQQHNAAWIGQYGLMVFGHDIPLAAGLDVIGHELTHGVTEKTAGLIYQDQPGALNESMSDIFGEMVETSRDGQPDWLMGDEIDFVIRNFKNPGAITRDGIGSYPSKMSEFKHLSPDNDHGGVHINSSIINHAFYLLAEGLNGALGLIDAEKIFYRCLTQHLQNQSQFIDARLGCIAAAEALYGADSIQAKKVVEAFDAVEIFATPSTPEPSPIPTVQGADSTLLIAFDPSFFELALGRREAALGDPVDGVALVESVKEARPAVSGDGSFAMFVDSANDLCGVNTADSRSLQCLGFRGLVHSVALSPNGLLAAFVLRDPATGQPQNQINVFNLGNNSTKTYKLLSPIADGTAVDDVLYADSMVFTSDSKRLIYDAVAQLRFAGGQPVQRWSIFAIDLATDISSVILPPQEGMDTGNPNMGRAGNRFLTFDAQDVKTGVSSIVNLDLFTGNAAVVGSAGKGLGYPCFTGDESAVVYSAQDPSAAFTGSSLVKQNLGSDRLTTEGQPSLWYSDASLGVIYRRGTFVSTNAPPQVQLISPVNGTSFPIPGSFTLEATAADPDGQIAKIEFYDGADKLVEDTTAPYRFTVNFDQTVQPHQFRLIARAIDNLGAATDSAAVTVTIGGGGQPGGNEIQVTAARLSGQTIRLTVKAAAGDYVIQQSTNLKTWADIYPVTVGAGGTGSVDDSGGPANNAYLFYRIQKK